MTCRWLWAALVAVLLAHPASAQDAKKDTRKLDEYEAQLARLLESARMQTAAPEPTAWMTGLFGDLRARRVNDLITVRVIENIAAAGSADSALDKSSNANSSLTRLFGLESKFPSWLDPTSLANPSSNSTFTGSGSTARSGSLTAMITARVTQVLPNGDLVLEGVREVDINGDRQFIVLSGIVRPYDISPGNIVSSAAVGQMQIRYFGRGLIRDNLKPGWLIRVLNKVF